MEDGVQGLSSWWDSAANEDGFCGSPLPVIGDHLLKDPIA